MQHTSRTQSFFCQYSIALVTSNPPLFACIMFYWTTHNQGTTKVVFKASCYFKLYVSISIARLVGASGIDSAECYFAFILTSIGYICIWLPKQLSTSHQGAGKAHLLETSFFTTSATQLIPEQSTIATFACSYYLFNGRSFLQDRHLGSAQGNRITCA